MSEGRALPIDDFPWARFTLVLTGCVLAAWLALMGVVLATGGLDDEAQGLMIVAFPPGLDDDAMLGRIVRADGRAVRQLDLGNVWVVEGEVPGFVGRLKEEGWLAAFRDLPLDVPLAGCSGVIAAGGLADAQR